MVIYFFRKNPFYLILILLTLSSCRKDSENNKWDNEILVPIASTSLSIQNLIGDTLSKDIDNQLNIIYNYDLYKARGTDFFKVPDTSLQYSMSLQSLKLSNNALNTSLTLGQLYPPAKLLNGQNFVIPAQSINSIPEFDVDATSFFETATLESGKMYIKINNGLPVNIAYAHIRLFNKSDNSEVGSIEFYNIQTKTSAEDSIDMAEKYVEGELVGKLEQLNTDASEGAVKINSNDAVNINIRVKDLTAYEATAIFPAQNLLDLDQNLVYKFGDPRITKMKIRSGELRVKLISTMDETIYVTYKSPGLTIDGDTVLEYFEVPPSSSSNPFSEERILNLKNYDVDFRGKASEGHVEQNMLHNIIIARIDSTGIMKSLSLSDSIYIFYGLFDIVPEYVEGYLGNYSQTVGPSSINIDAFDKIDGDLDIENVKLDLHIKNGMGLPTDLKLNNLQAIGKSGKTADLNAEPLINTIQLDIATNPPLTTSETTLIINNSNSNITDFVEVLPKSIVYELDIDINKNGNTGELKDFAFYDSPLEASLDITAPLKFQSVGLILTDKIKFKLGDMDLSKVKSAEFFLIAYNTYSFSVDPTIILYDDDNEVIDTIFTTNEFIDASNISSSEPQKTVLSQKATKAQLDKWQFASKAEIIATVETPKTEGYVTTKFNSKIDFTISAKFTYEQQITN